MTGGAAHLFHVRGKRAAGHSSANAAKNWYQAKLARSRRETRERQQRAAELHTENAARILTERLAMANSWTGAISLGERQQSHPNPEESLGKALAAMGCDYGQHQQSQAGA